MEEKDISKDKQDQSVSSSLRQQASDVIKTRIIKGVLEPGERLKEIELAEDLDISRGPIREALSDLEAIGLVESDSNRKKVVARVSEKEVSELLVPIRIQLELYSIRDNLDYYDKNFFQTLEGIVSNMETEIQKNEVFNVTEWDLKFHEAIITFSDSPFLKQIWEGIAQRTRIRVLDYLINYDHSQVKLHSMANTHWNLINTLKSRNFEEISKVFIDHIHVND